MLSLCYVIFSIDICKYCKYVLFPTEEMLTDGEGEEIIKKTKLSPISKCSQNLLCIFEEAASAKFALNPFQMMS